MTTLERLRASDPARDLDPTPPDDLLRTIVATPQRPRRSRRRRASLALVPVIAAAAAALVLLPGGSTDLAARAYAQSAPQADSILYVRTTTIGKVRFPGHDGDTEMVTDRWQQGERWRAVTRHNDGISIETRGADGVLSFSDGETARRADGPEMQEYIDRRSIGFLAEFRRDYERGKLDESGAAEFAGRPATRYVVDTPEPGNSAEYFLDAETGMPLGSRLVFGMHEPKRAPGGGLRSGKLIGSATYVVTVDALEQLPPTPENLAKLTG